MDTQIDLLLKNKCNSKQSKHRQLNGFSSMMSTQTAAVDFCEIKGQYLAKRALEIAAAGSYHTILIKAFPSILPDKRIRNHGATKLHKETRRKKKNS
jgi:predicted ATPase with chaperone activity